MNKNANDGKKSGYKTLLLSVLLSSPGPLILGLGLTVGRSSTQISDFTRRSAELLAIIASFVVYCITNGKQEMDALKKKRIECNSNIFVGIIMCISGISMIILAFVSDNEDKGNVVPALAIAFGGVIANTLFFRKYSALNKENHNAILETQARLYGAKSIVDSCITLSLFVVALFPGQKISYYFDIIGSVLVSAYMIKSGIKTIIQSKNRKKSLNFTNF